MKFNIEVGKSANDDLIYYDKFDQRMIVNAITKYLQSDANIDSRKRKQLRPNPVAPWELRLGKYRIFYEIKEIHEARVLAIGHKEHSELFIRGKKVEI